MHEIDRQAIDPTAMGAVPTEAGLIVRSERTRLLAELLAGIRRDELPTGDEKPLAGEGDFHPVIMDARGCIWVRLPADTKVETKELEVLRRIESLLQEQVALLRQIA